MAEVPGFGSGFSADAFRENIKKTMKMGSPNAVAERVTFRWPKQKTYQSKTDPTGKPYDIASSASSVEEKPDVQIDCAVEIEDRNATGTPIGEFNNPKATITILDVDYELVKGSTDVLIGGNEYSVNWVEPVGLFSVTVYTAHCVAKDES